MTSFILIPKRNIVIAVLVAAMHIVGLVMLQNGLLVRAYDMVVPVAMISAIIPPAKLVEPTPVPPAPPAPKPPPEPAKPTQAMSLPPAPRPLAMPDLPSAPNAPTAPVTVPAPPAPLPLAAAPVVAPVAVAALPAPAAAPYPAPAPPAPKIDLPRSDADHLSNPIPPYPPISKRLGEQGTVILRIFVGVDGAAQKAELRTSSGFTRLDAVALSTVLGWRFKPGTRNGVPEAMWVIQPIPFVINE